METIFGRRVDHHSREEGRALLVSIAQSVSGWFDICFKSFNVLNLRQSKMLLSIKSGASGLMISLDAFVLCAMVGIQKSDINFTSCSIPDI